MSEDTTKENFILDIYTRELIKYFIFYVLPNIDNEELSMPKINFVFSQSALLYFIYLMENSEQLSSGSYVIHTFVAGCDKFISRNNILNAIEILKNNNQEYTEYQQKGAKNDDIYSNIFLVVNDEKIFFELLRQIIYEFNNYDYGILYSLWLRMLPSDFNDVNAFLKKQVEFFANDAYFKNLSSKNTNEWQVIGEFNSLALAFTTAKNANFFETNSHILFSLDNGKNRYVLPAIHYALESKDGKKICYIYGIQDSSDYLKDEAIVASLNETKKFLRNPYVNFRFILVLKFMVDFLKAYDICDIKVPLLQVFNYPYHQNLSQSVKQEFSVYTPAEIAYMERMIANSKTDQTIRRYQRRKKWYDHVADKEDIISKNKTERLVETFMVLQEKYHDIEILSEPFIQDEFLHIKINDERKVER